MRGAGIGAAEEKQSSEIGRGEEYMKKALLVVLAIALAPFSAFAVDGVVLINDSIVKAQGGYPYKIMQPGSYRLSGNLVATLNQTAIQITANNVTLDLNGFNVTCSFDANYPTTSTFINCIGDTGSMGSGASDVTIRNGTVTATQTGGSFVFGRV